MLLNLEGTGTLQERLARAIRDSIHQGQLTPGDRLPAQRTLSKELSISRNVVLAAFEALRAEGYLEGRQGSGTYVCRELPEHTFDVSIPPVRFGARPSFLSKRARRIERASEVSRPRWAPSPRHVEIDFRYGPPAFRDLPFETFCRILGRRYRRATKRHLDYGPPTGALALREAVSRHLARARGVRCTAGQVVITRGTQEAIRLVAEVLVDPGDRVLMEDPGYLAARHVLIAHGARVVSGSLDGAGLHPSGVHTDERAPRLVWSTPSHQFPTGVIMPLDRRVALLKRAASARAMVLEDDYDGELRHDGQPIPSLQGLDADGRVLYAGGFSKSLFPALRIGYLVVPDGFEQAFEREKSLSDAGGNTPLQLAVADFIDGGHLERHLRRTRQANKIRRAALSSAVEECFGGTARISGASAGHHAILWLPDLPAEVADAIRGRARALRVGVYPISPFYTKPPPYTGFLLGYASLEPDQIREGIQRLVQAIP